MDFPHVFYRLVWFCLWCYVTDFLGLGLSAFGAVLQEVFYFKPQVIYVSIMFLTVLSYALGEFMAICIPRWGPVGRFLNPGPFNKKEHAAAVLMSSAASVSALYWSIGRPKTFLWRLSQCCCWRIHHYVYSVDWIRSCWYDEDRSAIPDKDVLPHEPSHYYCFGDSPQG